MGHFQSQGDRCVPLLPPEEEQGSRDDDTQHQEHPQDRATTVGPNLVHGTGHILLTRAPKHPGVLVTVQTRHTHVTRADDSTVIPLGNVLVAITAVDADQVSLLVPSETHAHTCYPKAGNGQVIVACLRSPTNITIYTCSQEQLTA